MNNIDPLLLLTFILGAGLLLLLGRFAFTGDLNEALLSVMATMIGGLISALSTRKAKGSKDKEGEDDGG